MAERRMFAKTIVDSDAFLDMPVSSQNLYFHLSMRADDDGFLNNPKKIQRMVNASDDDLRVLASKAFIIPFESGVIVIKHWRMSNYLRIDRYKPTVYQDEYSRLTIKENGAYSLDHGNQLATVGIPNGNQLATQVMLGKDSIDNTSSATPPKPEQDESFKTFYDAYPRKEARGQALKAYKAAIRKGISAEAILDRLLVYKARLEKAGTERQFIRLPSTFLHNLDDYEAAPEAPEPEYKPPLPERIATPEERAMLDRMYGRTR